MLSDLVPEKDGYERRIVKNLPARMAVILREGWTVVEPQIDVDLGGGVMGIVVERRVKPE